MQSANVGMIQTGNGLGFAFKPLLANRILGNLRRQNLDRHRALKPFVPRAIHLSHPACAERRRDFIGTKLCAWSEGHKLRDYIPGIVQGRSSFLFIFSRSASRKSRLYSMPAAAFHSQPNTRTGKQTWHTLPLRRT